MAQVRLRKDFYGDLIPKVSSDSLRVTVEFDYKGPAQTLDIEVSSGKKGLWGDYDQESPTYHTSKYVSVSDTPWSYSKTYTMPLSFWGDRKIEDCAVEVVIRGEGVYDDAVLWDAYTVNLVAVGVSFRMNIHGGAAGWVFPGANRWMCFYYDPEKGEFVGDGEWHFLFWRADFDNVSPGGYIAVYFLNTSTGEMSPQYTSPTWDIIDGHTYEYNPSYNEITDIS